MSTNASDPSVSKTRRVGSSRSHLIRNRGTYGRSASACSVVPLLIPPLVPAGPGSRSGRIRSIKDAEYRSFRREPPGRKARNFRRHVSQSGQFVLRTEPARRQICRGAIQARGVGGLLTGSALDRPCRARRKPAQGRRGGSHLITSVNSASPGLFFPVHESLPRGHPRSSCASEREKKAPPRRHLSRGGNW